MSFSEEGVVFECVGERLVGVFCMQADGFAGDTGLIVVVGGPQYRAGSHRQFVSLCRFMSSNGVPTLRFDVRGMGDSSGELTPFEASVVDIQAAIDTMLVRFPQVCRVVLWGLCDGASAALLYAESSRDPRIAGFCLLNPWVRSPASQARTHVKHYYGRRLMEREFWEKLLRGQMRILDSMREFLSKACSLVKGTSSASDVMSYQGRMARALREFSGETLLVLSGRDFTAKEFIEYATTVREWDGLLEASSVRRFDIVAADHTFSDEASRRQVEDVTLKWMRDCGWCA